MSIGTDLNSGFMTAQNERTSGTGIVLAGSKCQNQPISSMYASCALTSSPVSNVCYRATDIKGLITTINPCNCVISDHKIGFTRRRRTTDRFFLAVVILTRLVDLMVAIRTDCEYNGIVARAGEGSQRAIVSPARIQLRDGIFDDTGDGTAAVA